MLFVCVPLVMPLQQLVLFLADLNIPYILLASHVSLHLLQQSFPPYLQMMLP